MSKFNSTTSTITFKVFVLFFLLLGISINVFGQQSFPKRTMVATRINEQINLDGELDDVAWSLADVQGNFIQSVPFNGEPATEKSEVRILYDNDAVYVGAMLYDSSPDSIRRGLGIRDCQDDDIDAELFVVELNPYNDDLQLFDFKVSSSNVQIDEKVNFDTWDKNWDAVWYSKTKITNKGWSVEMKIPFSALRIPNRDIHTWGLQFDRNIKRRNEWNTWRYFDESIHGSTQQVGTLVGINNIKPPVRLSITPYMSGYYDKATNQKNGDAYMRGGLDLKYGINQSYTLDMMLIPDFGQTPSDDNVLNLSTVETFYNEKRSFFTEGTELFSRANLVYSRRIGGTPIYKDDVSNKLDTNEIIIKNPNEAQLINATKVSGRSNSGLAVGFLSATAVSQHAIVRDSISGNEREIQTQPVTNYSVLVFDQALKNNSYISLINTHVSYFDDPHKYANVIGTDFSFHTPNNSYTIGGKGAYSYLDKTETKSGYYYEAEFGKTSGQFRYSLWHQIRSDKYDCRDLGYLDETNRINNTLRFEYNHYVPKYFFLSWYNALIFVNNYHYKPIGYSMFEIYFESFMRFKNQMTASIYFGGGPTPKYDYNEPRVAGWKYQEPTSGYFGGNYTTDKKKRLWVFVNSWYWRASKYNRSTFFVNIRPTYKISDRISFSGESILERPVNSFGYISNNSAQDTIIFGRRQSRNITSILSGKYMFSANSSVQIRGRYYWSGVEYKQFYILKKDGTMNDNTPFISGKDVNFSSFNIDLTYTWQFAPGSELSIMWKNSILHEGNYLASNYGSNLKDLWDNPQLNSFSFKILYYFDYQYLGRKRKG